MLSPDLVMGLRMDINRPIGNGRDDNSNAVVDEAYGVGDFAALNESLGPEYAKNGDVNIMAIDHDNDGVITPDADAHLARGYLARHLYVLLMLLKDPAFYYDVDGDGTPTPEETAQVLAQWAINAVDFRDADSTMTPFEYDWNPFDGWAVDGNVLTNDAADGADNDGDGQTDDANEQTAARRLGLRAARIADQRDAWHFTIGGRKTLTSDPSGQTTTDPSPDTTTILTSGWRLAARCSSNCTTPGPVTTNGPASSITTGRLGLPACCSTSQLGRANRSGVWRSRLRTIRKLSTRTQPRERRQILNGPFTLPTPRR